MRRTSAIVLALLGVCLQPEVQAVSLAASLKTKEGTVAAAQPDVTLDEFLQILDFKGVDGTYDMISTLEAEIKGYYREISQSKQSEEEKKEELYRLQERHRKLSE